ncbi:GntR family transcriptional regulator [Jeotgalibacillus proteolyticus]|uniref:GntR family transcriptional regulator n=1 Tax=Jeotgalibacillus proteolyticus TaxID=2082395 RepID=A0A2S5GDI2_9BACL|nr:GntR family transcriptional regulator [Jeotgalibacillus proteolyticus]PPA71097.1 GntR family transcriptional regulator [Jeotgalibacillus proteolyticus]
MNLPIRLSKSSREPIYHQIENQIKALIASGQLSTGDPLPSIRLLAKELEISSITIRRAYQNLEFGGFIQTSQGKGTFVAEVDADMKTTMANQAVEESIRKAISTARQHELSDIEIIHLVEALLKKEEN